MKLISIDPGFDKVGYAIFDKTGNGNSDFTYITSDLIKTSPKSKHEQRLKKVYEELEEVIEKHQPKVMVIEQLFMFRNQKTVIKVAQAIGVIELVASVHDLQIERLTPLQIKQMVTGYGNVDKKSVQKMIELTLSDKIEMKDDDQADAIACGLAYCFQSNFS
ncbi:crossover junction endodeoxyribonuclease RuvC [Candidatus Roizmanbacteria bacterium]|nr:MAG: crossover junction endodeoxyribonuclease RuvC [Candidatus Roizmanbacteria bacterium]